MRSTRNICSGLLMAIAVAVGISFFVEARTPRTPRTPRSSANRVHENSGRNRNINSNSSVNNYKIREEKDGVTVITYDDSKSNRKSAARNKKEDSYTDPLYDDESNDGKKMRRVIKEIGDFSGVSASRGIKIVYTPGTEGPVIIEGLSKYAKAISLSVSPTGVLEIRNNYRGDNTIGAITVKCSSTQLRSINLSSASNFESTNLIESKENFSVSISSASDVNIPSLKCQSLTIDGSSASTVKIPYVTSDDININLSSASNFNATQIFGMGKAVIDLSSAGEVKIDRLVCSNLSADCSSASKSSIANISTVSAGISCSSSAEFYVRGSMICNGVTGFANLYTSSAASIHIGSVKSVRSSLEAYSQSKVTVDNLMVNSVAMDVVNSTIKVAGKAEMADISAGTMGYVEARNFDVDTADVGASRYAKVSVKAGHINYK